MKSPREGRRFFFYEIESMKDKQQTHPIDVSTVSTSSTDTMRVYLLGYRKRELDEALGDMSLAAGRGCVV